jgi:hypothetical protein
MADIKGYRPITPEIQSIVNEFKEDEERILRKIDRLKQTNVPSMDTLDTPYDARWLNIAFTHIQEGFMALNRAVFKPERIKLKGDPD